MAYLPPAGKRCLTDYKLSCLPTMTEIENPLYTEKMLSALRKSPKKTLAENQLTPLKKAHSDVIGFKPVKKPNDFYTETVPMRPFCLGTPACNYKKYDVHAPSVAIQYDPLELPYGLPPETHDVRIRTNWFDYWKEDNFKYTGAFRLWERQYGDKYLYPFPKPAR